MSTSRLNSRQPSRRRATPLVLFVAIALVVLDWQSVDGFFPTKLRAILGAPGSSTHESMTIQTLLGVTIGTVTVPGLVTEFFDVVDITGGMKAAAQDIADANAEVDDDQSPELHFDAEFFTQSQNQLRRLADETHRHLLAGDIVRARTSLGGALHTLQDFYSHSNWVELGFMGLPSSPQFTLPAPQLAPPFPPFDTQGPHGLAVVRGETACDQEAPEPDTLLLTSGYYGPTYPPTQWGSGIPPRSGGCHHGGVTDALPGPGINKDSLSPVFSPNNLLHLEAARLARESTRGYIRSVRTRLLDTHPDRDIAEDTLHALFGLRVVRLTNNNNVSFAQMSLEAGVGAVSTTLDFLPLQTHRIDFPELSACQLCAPFGTTATHFEIRVQGESSASITGLIGYTLRLPPSLEFVEIESDRGTTTPISGQTHSDLFVLRPLGGQPHGLNTYVVRQVIP
jgi:hypothetical protein